MLLVGTEKTFNEIKDRFKVPVNVFNIFYPTQVSGFPVVGILPNLNVIDYNSREFDVLLMNHIIGNDGLFYLFFKEIIYPLYDGYDVFILIPDTENAIYYDMVDSLLKIVQQRYQYNGAVLNEPDDFDGINFDEGFGIAGIYNLDIDRERFVLLNTPVSQPNAPIDNFPTEYTYKGDDIQ